MPEIIETAIIPEKGQYLGIKGVSYKIADVSYIHKNGELITIELKLEKQCSG